MLYQLIDDLKEQIHKDEESLEDRSLDPEIRGKFRLGFLLNQIKTYIDRTPAFNGYRPVIHLFVCRKYDTKIVTNEKRGRRPSI